MKLLVKSAFTLLFLLLITNISFAQKPQKAPYNALIYLVGKIKVHGKITAINDTALVIVDKREVSQSISYARINRIKVFKRHKDIGYAVVTGALVAGSIVASQSIDDGATAMLVGFGGTAAVATLSIALHNVLHGPELKIDARKDKIDYQNMSQKLSKYVVNDAVLNQ